MTAFGRRLLATLVFASALFAADVPVLRTEGSQWVLITHPGLEASWKIQFPEAIGTGDAFYLVWYPISAEWKTQANGEIRYAWKASKVGAHSAVDKPASKARTQKTPAQRTAKRKSRWMDGFSIRDPAPRRPPSPATPVALRAPSAADDTS